MNTQIAPCHGQSEEEIKDWMKANVQIGTVVAIRNTQGGLLHYLPAEVTRLGRGRFTVEPQESYGLGTGGSNFYYSGKNCWHPKGQTRLVIPTPAVIAAYGPPGELGLYYGPLSVF